MLEEGECSLCALPRQHEQQKWSSLLLINGILQSCITSFWTAALGWPSLECQVLEAMEFTEAEFTGEWCKLELGLRELVLTLKEGLDSKLRNLYKPLELRFPLRSISMDAWDLTKPTLGWNSKNTELSFAKWLTLSRFLEILVSCKKLWRLRLTLELNGDKN